MYCADARCWTQGLIISSFRRSLRSFAPTRTMRSVVNARRTPTQGQMANGRCVAQNVEVV
jgi:hypothetical protein